MTIEVLVKWTEAQIKSQDQLEKLLGDEEEPSVEFKHSYSPMCFEIEDIAKFNKGNDPECTVIRFADNDTFMVKVPYERFRDLWTEATGRVVLSLLDENEEKPKKRRKGNSGLDLGI